MTITDWRYWKSKWDDERIHSKALEGEVRRAKEERDAIQAKTIEECLEKLPEDTPAYVRAATLEELEILAKDCEECAEAAEAESNYSERRAWQSVADRIRRAASAFRALAQTDEGKS